MVEVAGIAWYWWTAAFWAVGAFITVIICGALDVDDEQSVLGFALFWPFVFIFFACLITAVIVGAAPWYFGAWIRKRILKLP